MGRTNYTVESDPLGRTRREIVARTEGLPIFRGIAHRTIEYSDAQLDALTKSLPKPAFKTDRSAFAKPLGNRPYRRPNRSSQIPKKGNNRR